MKKRLLLFCVILFMLFSLTGCYDSRGMDEINIVSGIAVDKGEDGQYLLTLEIVDLSAKENTGGTETMLVESEGPTIFEAVRNSKLRLFNKLYFGNMHTLVVSQKLAREDGITEIFEVFLRDVEPRENISVLISQEESARELVTSEGIDAANISHELNKIVFEDKNVASNTKQLELYEAYNMLYTEGHELVLPSFHLTNNGDKEIVEVSGIAIFKEDKLVSFLSPLDTHYFLIAAEDDAKGALSFPSPKGDGYLVSVEVYGSKNKTKLSYTGGRLHVNVSIDIKLGVTENYTAPRNGLEPKELTTALEDFLEIKTKEVFLQLQENPGCDIYGYGEKMYEEQYPLWQTLKGDWDAVFREAEFEVEISAGVVSTGLASGHHGE